MAGWLPAVWRYSSVTISRQLIRTRIQVLTSGQAFLIPWRRTSNGARSHQDAPGMCGFQRSHWLTLVWWPPLVAPRPAAR
jgi:hypothetical protein